MRVAGPLLSSTVDLSEHDVERADERDHVRDEMSFHQPSQSLQIAERRRAHAKTGGVRGLAVADDEITELAFRRLDRVIGFTGWRFDEARHLADDRSFGNSFGR